MTTLNENDLSRISRVGDRLKTAFNKLIRSFPPSALGITKMSRWLGTGKSICQRVVEGTTKSRDGIETARMFPGVDGLRGFLDMAKKRRCDAVLLEKAGRAVDEYQQIIATYGGSQRSLLRALQQHDSTSSSQGDENSDALTSRRKLYESAKDLLGESREALLRVAAVYPHPDSNDFISEVTVCSHIGLRRSESARPFSLVSDFPSATDFGDNMTAVLAKNEASRKVSLQASSLRILDELSSPNVKYDTVHRSDSSELIIFDSDEVGESGLTVSYAIIQPASQPNPLLHTPRLVCMATGVTRPTKTVIIECYVHKSLAMRSIPSIGVYPMTTSTLSVMQAPEEFWYDKYPERPELKMLGRADALTPEPSHSQTIPLANAAFKESGMDPADFVVYRCEVEYPTWSLNYRTYLEFAGDE